jgi:ABC-type proline/glycine betaine transport system permease subunit
VLSCHLFSRFLSIAVISINNVIPSNTNSIKPAKSLEISNRFPDSIIVQASPFELPVPATNFALPYILTGMKTSIGLALIGTVVAEFVAGTGSSKGLAWTIIESGNRLDISKLFAGLMLLVLLGITLFMLMTAIERNLLKRWHESTQEDRG